MNALVVDTSSWISYFARKDESEIDRALQEGRVFLPPIVAAELLSGRLKPKEERSLVAFIKELPLCESGIEHWVRVGRLRSLLSRKGLKVSTPDAHIAQCALDLDCFLLSEDRIFSKIPQYSDLRLLSAG